MTNRRFFFVRLPFSQNTALNAGGAQQVIAPLKTNFHQNQPDLDAVLMGDTRCLFSPSRTV